jgi:hypothetical protein
MRAMTSTIPFSLIAMLALVAGCASPPETIVRPVALPVPARPVLPRVPGAVLQCLSDATYTDLVTRERKLKRWGEQLQAVIQANNRAADSPEPTGGR